jgi:hypothetical protein
VVEDSRPDADEEVGVVDSVTSSSKAAGEKKEKVSLVGFDRCLRFTLAILG